MEESLVGEEFLGVLGFQMIVVDIFNVVSEEIVSSLRTCITIEHETKFISCNRRVKCSSAVVRK